MFYLKTIGLQKWGERNGVKWKFGILITIGYTKSQKGLTAL